MKITKEQLKQIIKEELGKNYHLGRHQHGNPTTLYINFRNLKDVGENMPGGVDPDKISELLEQAFYDNNADYFLHHPFVKVDNTGGGGYIDPSQSKYKVFLNFEDEQQYEDFKTEELDLIMQQVNDKVEKYAMELKQYKLDLKEGKITKEQLKQIIEEELSKVLNETSYKDNTRVDKFIRAGADPASHPYAKEPPSMPPNYLEPTSKEDLCSGWKNMFENGGEWERGFSFLKADHVGCEWLEGLDVEALRLQYPDPYADIMKKNQ